MIINYSTALAKAVSHPSLTTLLGLLALIGLQTFFFYDTGAHRVYVYMARA